MLSILPATTHARLVTTATSQDLSGSAPSWLAITFMTVALLTLVIVVLAAVFGNDKRRKDAFRVLDRLLRAFTGR